MNVLFVVMPFGSVRPAIGVSLLKSRLRQLGIPCRVTYPTMRFAAILGGGDYRYLADQAPSQALMGDWVFSEALFGPRPEADAGYLQMLQERFGHYIGQYDIAGLLQRARQAVPRFLEQCLEEVDWSAYDIVGFTSTFTQNTASLALARRVKERAPHVRIIFGGANCEAEMGLQLHRSFPFIDYVCSGEADCSFPQLAAAIANGGDVPPIPGVISRQGDASHFVSFVPERIRHLDDLPYPEYDDFIEEWDRVWPGSTVRPSLLMETSRGCWWGQKSHCTFCGLNGMTMAFRSKTSLRALEELDYLRERYRPSYIQMVDNILDMRYFQTLLPELRKRQQRLDLFYETKANLTKAQIQELHDAGITSIQPGIESFSSNVLKAMRKGTTGIQNVQLLKWCKEIGITPLWNIIYGFPDESPQDYDDTARIIEAIHHLRPAEGFGAIRLDRFSPNFTEAESHGITNVRVDRSYTYIYDLPDHDLFGLAYYFEHDYADGRDPESYIQGARAAFGRWKGNHERAQLVYVDHGDALAIWDSRPGADRALTVLSGSQRVLYLYCDQNRSAAQIAAFLRTEGVDPTEIEAMLRPLLQSRLMLEIDGRFLSLAIPHKLEESPAKPGMGAAYSEYLPV